MQELQKEYERAEQHYLLTGNYTWMAEVAYKINKLQSK